MVWAGPVSGCAARGWPRERGFLSCVLFVLVRPCLCLRVEVAIQESIGEEEAAAGAMLVGARASREPLFDMAAVVGPRGRLARNMDIVVGSCGASRAKICRRTGIVVRHLRCQSMPHHGAGNCRLQTQLSEMRYVDAL